MKNLTRITTAVLAFAMVIPPIPVSAYMGEEDSGPGGISGGFGVFRQQEDRGGFGSMFTYETREAFDPWVREPPPPPPDYVLPDITITGRRSVQGTISWGYSGATRSAIADSDVDYGITEADQDWATPPPTKAVCEATCTRNQETENRVCDYTGAQLIGVTVAGMVALSIFTRRGGRLISHPDVTAGQVARDGAAVAASYVGLCRGLAANRAIDCTNNCPAT